MIKSKRTFCVLLMTTMLVFSTNVFAAEVYSLRLFFGLSMPDGGAVSLNDWQKFERGTIAKTFDGFNVVSSTGYYKGKAERSKIVTLIVEEKDVGKAKHLAKLYATRFKQESVMMVKVPVAEWSFINAGHQ